MYKKRFPTCSIVSVPFRIAVDLPFVFHFVPSCSVAFHSNSGASLRVVECLWVLATTVGVYRMEVLLVAVRRLCHP